MRERVKRSRLAAVWHQKLACALGSALEKNWRLHLQKTLLVHENARCSCHFASHAQITRHLWTSQIEVAILESQLLVDLARGFRIIDSKRQNVCGIEYLKSAHSYFYFAGRSFRVVRP